MNPRVDEYLRNVKNWQSELETLRHLVLECGPEEELKWRQPCYTFQGKNIIILGEFKNYCVISFLKGALMADPNGILEKPGENSQSAKIVKFTSVDAIRKLEDVLKSYIFEAMEIEKLGLKVEKKTKLDLVEELRVKLIEDNLLKSAFEALTPGRQRAYNMFFAGSNNPKTRISRIEKYKQRILNGKGMNDCVCGLSKRMPNCDGSHKSIS